MADVSRLTRLPVGVLAPMSALDEQTLHDKAPAAVAAAAVAAGVPVVAVCGRNLLDTESLRSAGIIAVYAITDLEPDAQKCIADPAPLLARIGERMATDLLSAEGAVLARDEAAEKPSRQQRRRQQRRQTDRDRVRR